MALLLPLALAEELPVVVVGVRIELVDLDSPPETLLGETILFLATLPARAD